MRSVFMVPVGGLQTRFFLGTSREEAARKALAELPPHLVRRGTFFDEITLEDDSKVRDLIYP